MRHLFCVIIILSVLILHVTVSAEIQQSRNPLVDSGVNRIIQLFPESGIGLPSNLKTNNDVYVIISTGGAYTGVRMFGKDSVPGQKLASVLELAVMGTVLADKPITWDDNSEYSAASARYSNGQFGNHESSNLVPIGKIVSGIRDRGFNPHVLLRVPKYAVADLLPPERYSTRNYRWYNESSASENRQINVRVALPWYSNLLTFLFVFFVPFITLMSFFLAILITKNSRIPITKRRSIYRKMLIFPVFGAIALHMPFAFIVIRSGILQSVTDLWFGNPTASTYFAQIMMLSFPILLIALIVCSKFEKKLFGPEGEDSALPEVSSKEQALNKRILLLSFVPIIAGFALIYIKNYVLSPDNSFRIYLFPLALLIIAFGPHLVRHVFKKPLEEIVVKDMQDHDIDLHRREEESEQVRNRAFSLAQKMGVSLGGLDIDESMTGRRYASAVVLMNNRVKVSRMALEVLSPTELDFILAHEIAHIKEKDIAKQSATLLISMLLIMSPFFLRYTRITLHPTLTSDLMLFAVPMSGMILLFGLSFWLSKRREYKADQLALMETRDVKSAQSALVNMIRRSPLPYAHDFDEASTHPRISKRLEALRQIAKEIGLSSITQTD